MARNNAAAGQGAAAMLRQRRRTLSQHCRGALRKMWRYHLRFSIEGGIQHRIERKELAAALYKTELQESRSQKTHARC